MPSPFNVLLVGAGEQAWESRGPSIQALAANGVVLAALASPSEGRRLATAERLGLERTYGSMADALQVERIDGAVITAPNGLHEQLTLEALAGGCHVLCEKPMALDAAGGRRMIDAAERATRVLAVGYQYPWMQPGLAELADAGGLDSVFRAEGHWTRAAGVPEQPGFWNHPGAGAAGDLLGHLLSVIRVGIRSRPVWASAFAWNRFGREAHGDAFLGHDTLETTVAFEDERTAHLAVAWAMNMSGEESIGVAFHGTDVSMEVPLMGRELDVDRFLPVLYRREGGRPERTLIADPPPVQTEDTFVLQARDWIAACRGRRELRFRAEDALQVQAILDAVIDSAADGGRPVDVRS